MFCFRSLFPSSSSSPLSSPLSSSSSSSTSRVQHKYDVFLSFRGEDTRTNFVDHLYAALKGSGIITFKDDERLEAGEAIAPELINAIEESWCSVIVFSRTYAFSSWCLDELAEIVKQREERGHKVFPIFYDVDPSHLRKQRGIVGKAFAKHRRTFKHNKQRIERWRSALTQVANLKGWHLKNRQETEFIGDIIKIISAKLCQTYPVAIDDMIGINERLKELNSKIEIEKNDVRIIGICGMGGVGKTTIARAVYSQLSPNFESKCFLADVREVSEKYGLVSLQKQLLSQTLSEEGLHIFNVYDGNEMISRRLSLKKVLVVVDDVDNIQHLQGLVGRRDWFGPGSRIIITTRDEHLLRTLEVDDVYKPSKMNDIEALRLFSLKAFGSYGGILENDDIFELSTRVVEYADGLPLILEVLGSFLRGRDIAQWRSAIERLKKDSNIEILDRLRISFDGLKETEKNIFLDIACFFNGEDKDFVINILDGCELFPDIGIGALIEKSLLTVDKDDKLRMHDLLQEMGRNIVRQLGKHRRLWEESDVFHVLTENTVTEAVEGIIIDIKSYQVTRNFWGALSNMKRLRLLRVFNPSNLGDLKYLSQELRLLEWHGYPFRALPSSFQPDNLVALLLPSSRIEQLWGGNRIFKNLRFLNLKGCQNLVQTPSFSLTPNLERLILEGCTRLVDVDPTVGDLKRLKLLNLRDCMRLVTLPFKLGMESLEILILSGCSNLQRFPEIDGKMECLVELHLDGTEIKELPSSIGHLSSLALLNLSYCEDLVSLPSSMDGLKSLKTLNLFSCSKVESLPEGLERVQSLEVLDLRMTAIRKPPSFIFQYKNLKVFSFNSWPRGSSEYSKGLMLPPLSGLTSITELNLSYCNLHEGAIPSDICRLSSLKKLHLVDNDFITLPTTLSQLSNLCHLRLSDCKKLKSLSELPTSLEGLNIDNCGSFEAFTYPTTTASHSVREPYIYGLNCYKLVQKSNAGTILKKFLKVYANANTRRNFHIFIPGNKIPEWFKLQREGCSIKIPLPHHIRNDSQWMGIAFCAMFVFPSSDNGDDMSDDSGINCRLRVNVINGRNPQQVQSAAVNRGFVFNRWQRVSKHHLWLSHWSRESLGIYRDEDAEFEFLFEPDTTGVRPKINKCGIQIVYQNDLQVNEEEAAGLGVGECPEVTLPPPKRRRLEQLCDFSPLDIVNQANINKIELFAFCFCCLLLLYSSQLKCLFLDNVSFRLGVCLGARFSAIVHFILLFFTFTFDYIYFITKD